MKLKSRHWSDLTTRDFAQLKCSPELGQVVAVLPVAATEQHGPHLPVSVDTDLVNGVLNAALPLLPDDVPVLVLPTQAVGKSNEHLRFPGTLTLSTSTVLALWKDIGAGVAAAGIQKLVLFNAHGGHVSVMDLVARDLRAEQGLMVFSSNWYTLPFPPEVEGLFSADEHRYGIHAGDMETSMMLALRPQWVDMTQARDFASASQARKHSFPLVGNGKSAKLGWQIQDYNPMGAVGNATLATADKGHALIQASAAQLALLLQEVSRLPVSTLNADPAFPD